MSRQALASRTNFKLLSAMPPGPITTWDTSTKALLDRKVQRDDSSTTSDLRPPCAPNHRLEASFPTILHLKWMPTPVYTDQVAQQDVAEGFFADAYLQPKDAES
jgi:hypothetical protein